MNIPNDPADDIIELTDIVEEGAPADQDFEDFAMDKAVDVKSLDQELDDLLRDEGSAPKPGPKDGLDMDFDTLFEEDSDVQPAQAAAPSKAPVSQASDISDLDDLFESLQLGDQVEDTSLDVLLDEKSQGSDGQIAPVSQPDDTIDLDLDIPDLEAAAPTPDLLELTDDLLADIPDTVLVPPAEIPEPKITEASVLPAPEGLDLDLDLDSETRDSEAAPAKAPVTEPAQPEVESAAPASISQAELEILSARLDALEARPEPTVEIRPEQVLAAMPGTPDELPLANALRTDIMQALEEKLAVLATASELESVRTAAADAAGRIDALETRPEPALEVRPEQVLAALPQSPDELPMAQALRAGIMQAVEEKLSTLAPASELAALRDGIIGDVEAKLAGQAPSEGIEEFRGALSALQEQVDAMPEMLARLAAPSTQALQELENGVGALHALAQSLEQGLADMRGTIAEKDAAIAELREGEERLREELEALGARLDAQPAAGILKGELEEYIRQQVPAAVAKIIREEIQALLKELGS